MTTATRGSRSAAAGGAPLLKVGSPIDDALMPDQRVSVRQDEPEPMRFCKQTGWGVPLPVPLEAATATRGRTQHLRQGAAGKVERLPAVGL